MISGECAWLPVLGLAKNHYLLKEPWVLHDIDSSDIFKLVFYS